MVPDVGPLYVLGHPVSLDYLVEGALEDQPESRGPSGVGRSPRTNKLYLSLLVPSLMSRTKLCVCVCV